MNYQLHLVWLGILTYALSPRTHAVPAIAPGELLLKWKDGPASNAAAQGNARIGSTVKRNFHALGWQLVRLPPDLSTSDGIGAYQALSAVLAMEPNAAEPLDPPLDGSTNSLLRSISVQSLQVPNDPRYTEQWSLRKISAPAAWDVTTGDTNIVIAVLDRGVNFAHPDLAANMWQNPGEMGLDARGTDKSTNGIDDDDNGYIDDVSGADVENGTGDPKDTGHEMVFDPPEHGTFCAGIIAAVGNNGIGITGLNWRARIMAIRFAGGDRANTKPYLPRAYWSDNLAAWDYIVMMKRRGVNIRVTSNSYADYYQSAAVRDAIAQAGSEDILCVFSGGNQAIDTDQRSRNPGGYNLPSVLVAAATDESDRLAFFSNFGRSSVHLAAPGVNFISTAGTNYLTGQMGTSFACPLVAGTAALLLSVDPTLTVDQLKAAILGSVDQPPALRGKVITNGRLNVARALDYLTNANPPAIVIQASPAGQWTPTNAPTQVTFNRPMNRQTVESAFVVTPPVNGRFQWSADDRSISFQHDVPFDSTTNYTVRVLGTAQDQSGGTLDGDWDRNREGSPNDDFIFTFRFRISNDDFIKAESIVGMSGFRESSNRHATFELTEPDHLADGTSMSSVWYRWAAPEQGGWFTFDLTRGTPFDSVLAVYSGDQLDRLVTVTGNDNYGNRTSSRVSFPAVAGMAYSVVVAGKSGDETKRFVGDDQAGNFRLSWYPTPPSGFTGSQFSPTSAIPGTKVTLTGTNFTAVTRVLFNGASASFTHALTNNADLRITAVIPPDGLSGPITLVTPQGNIASTASFQVLPPPLTARLAADGQVEISWPATSDAFVLESSTDLATVGWEPMSISPVRSEGWSRVLGLGTGNPRYFRLRSSPIPIP